MLTVQFKFFLIGTLSCHSCHSLGVSVSVSWQNPIFPTILPQLHVCGLAVGRDQDGHDQLEYNQDSLNVHPNKPLKTDKTKGMFVKYICGKWEEFYKSLHK